jgi:DNA sulfur modification protein DndB
LKSKQPEKVTRAQRGPHGGNLLFRPIGLEIVTRVAIEMAQERAMGLPDAVSKLKSIPTDLAEAPYRDVIWDPARCTMIPAGKTLARRLIRYMMGFSEETADLLGQYRIAQGVEPDNTSVKLPGKVV